MLLIAAILLVIELLYIPLARRFNIGAAPGPRSSSTHLTLTPTGGGIIFIFAAAFAALTLGVALPPHFAGILIGGAVLAVVSFIDDIHDLRPASRLAIQVVTVAAAYWWLHFWPDVYLLTLILGVGFINAYNFMDGISGMLAAYSLVTLGAILYAFHSLGIADTADTSLTVSLLVATVIFGIFNFRRRSLVFCGDVGSIVMGYFILYLMVRLTLLGHDASCIVMLMVYGVDTVLTIFGRLFKGRISSPRTAHTSISASPTRKATPT